MPKKEREKPEGMSVHEALSDRKALLGFLKEGGEGESLEGLSLSERLTKRTAEYLESRGVPPKQVEDYVKLRKRISEDTERAWEETQRDLADGLRLPRSLIEALKIRRETTY